MHLHNSCYTIFIPVVLTMKGDCIWKKVKTKILKPNVVVTIVIVVTSFVAAGTKVVVAA